MVFFDFQKFPLADALPILLSDKTTGKNIIFATDEYKNLSEEAEKTSEIQVDFFSPESAFIIEPRVVKALEQKQTRTKQKAEVFTPSWICNLMNNDCDEVWFGKRAIFNSEINQQWTETKDKVPFQNPHDWEKYVFSPRLEITCGEAPFIVSRYDTVTGEPIPVEKRIGILDRKIRVVSENTINEKEWLEWTTKAFQSVYGYEFQGDNLLIARSNLLLAFCDYVSHYLRREPTADEIKKIAEIIVWNIWQMDGLTGLLPFDKPEENELVLDLFDDRSKDSVTDRERAVFDWKNNRKIFFSPETKMKFDFVIGNPPYQDESVGDQKAYTRPVYHFFIDEAAKISSKVELIHPARFLFDAGGTPKEWNQKMLQSPHFKILRHELVSARIFPNTDIKGGVVISYQDSEKKFEPIGTYSAFPELTAIVKKVCNSKDVFSLNEIIANRGLYRFSASAYQEHPRELEKVTDSRLTASSFERMPSLFLETPPSDGKKKSKAKYVQILGLSGSKRVYRWFRKDYLNDVASLTSYKVIVPSANGSGALGEVPSTPLIGQPLIGQPLVGHTETFMSIGSFEKLSEAEACLKYIKTKFARALLGVLKVTQHNSPDKWKYVPLQDFTSTSDIDWSRTIPDIDQQLYKKYGLSNDEINFIETHVKEMN